MPGSPLSLDLARMLEEVRKAGGKLGAQHLEDIAARIGRSVKGGEKLGQRGGGKIDHSR